MEFQAQIDQALAIVVEDDVNAAASPYHRAIFDRAPNNGVVAAALVMDAAAMACVMAQSPGELRVMTNLIQEAVNTTIAKRLCQLALKGTPEDLGVESPATVH